jgi:hypothetical protein
MGVVPAQDPGPGKAKQRSMSWILIQSNLGKARNSNLVEVRVQYIIWSHLRKKDSTTGVLGEVTQTQDRNSKNLTRTRNVSHKWNKQVRSKQQTRFSLTSINKSSKTTEYFELLWLS